MVMLEALNSEWRIGGTTGIARRALFPSGKKKHHHVYRPMIVLKDWIGGGSMQMVKVSRT
jgi:hypothetical protein